MRPSAGLLDSVEESGSFAHIFRTYLMMARRFAYSVFLGILATLLVGPGRPAMGQVLEDVVRYSRQLPSGGGERMGMAGAGRNAGYGRFGTLYGNPAGLGWVSQSMLGGDFTVERARNETTFRTPNETTGSDRATSNYRLGPLGGAYSFPTEKGSAVIGVSFHQSNSYEGGFDVTGENGTNSITKSFLPSSFGFDEEGNFIINNFESRIAFQAGAIDTSSTAFANGNYPFVQAATPGAVANQRLEQQETILESGQMNEVSIGGAVEVAPGVMVGGGLNITFGSYTFERFYRETDVVEQGEALPNDPYFVEGTNLDGFKELRFEEQIDTDLTGANVRLGVSAELTDGLRTGLLIETPTWYSITEVFGKRMETTFDCDALGCTPSGVPGFVSGSLTGREVEYRLTTPWRLGGGVQYSRAGLTVAGDVEFVDWTQADLSSDNESFSDLERQIRALDATVNARVGMEYDFDVAAVRAGFAYQPDPRDRSLTDVDGASTDGDRLYLSGGISYTPTDTFALHLNWLQERFDDRFQSYVGGPTVREQLRRNRYVVGMTFRF